MSSFKRLIISNLRSVMLQKEHISAPWHRSALRCIIRTAVADPTRTEVFFAYWAKSFTFATNYSPPRETSPLGLVSQHICLCMGLEKANTGVSGVWYTCSNHTYFFPSEGQSRRREEGAESFSSPPWSPVGSTALLLILFQTCPPSRTP